MSTRIHKILLKLWDQAVDQPGYDKQEWAELQRLIYHLEGSIELLELLVLIAAYVDSLDDEG